MMWLLVINFTPHACDVDNIQGQYNKGNEIVHSNNCDRIYIPNVIQNLSIRKR